MRELEINIIASKIPNSNDLIICKMESGNYVVSTSDGCLEYSLDEIKEIYNFNPSKCERLGWPA